MKAAIIYVAFVDTGEINFITFALRSHYYPRLHHQPITARCTVYIIIAEVVISRSSRRRSIMVNPAAEITRATLAAMVLV